jgi:hypothetical protein
MSLGWVKLNRKIKDHWIWDKSEYFQAFVAIIMECNHSDQKCLISGQLIDCKRGQKIYSLSTWAKVFGKGWTVQKVRTFFKLLESDSIINTQGLQKTTRLTLINYSTYQGEQHTDEQKVTHKQLTENEQRTNKKRQLKNVKNEKNDQEDKDVDYKVLFDTARKLYQGSKNGLDPEWDNFKKKNPVKVASDILLAVKYQIAWRDELKNSDTFVAPWKNFSTWINKQCWTEEKPQVEETRQKQTQSSIMV